MNRCRRSMSAMAGAALLALLLAGCDSGNEAGEGHDEPISDGWLGSAASDAERFRELEGYLGGFSSAMWETGYRYQHVHQALLDDNFELAAYHWDKIGSAIRNGYRKRPGRQQNSDAIFLDAVWERVLTEFESGEAEAAWAAFEQGRAACQACHEAEDVSFMNDQPMFTELRAPDA